MSNEIKLTVELGPESQGKLDAILAALEGLRPNCASCAESVAVAMGENLRLVEQPEPAAHADPVGAPGAEGVTGVAPEAEHPVNAVPPHAEPETVAPAEEPETAITLEQIRQKVTNLTAAGGKKKEGARDIVKSYAANVTGLKEHEDKWPEIWAKLTALEG